MSNTHAISLRRSTALLVAMSFTALLLVVNFASLFSTADAAQLQSRKLTLSSTLPGTETGNGTPGDPSNGSAATYTFEFTKSADSDAADRISFEFCTNAIGTCVAVPGLDLTSANIGTASATAGTLSGLTLSGANDEIATLTSTGFTAGSQVVSIELTNVENPAEITAFFVRISLYANAAPATILDEGTVASAIVDGIEITARVAETLGFSTTGDFSGVGDPGTDCDPLTGTGALTLGDPTEGTLAMNNAYDNYSAFRVYTNAATGVNIFYEGQTLTKGADDIDAVATDVLSDVGVEQFGLAIDTASGGDSGGASVPVTIESSAGTLEFQYVDTAANFGGAGNITIDTDYDGGAGAIQEEPSTALFTFEDTSVNPAQIASSTGYVECNTAAVRYLANIATTTPAGTYTTTLVYSAVPTY